MNSKSELNDIIEVLQSRFSDEQDERNRLAHAMTENQQLLTSEERLNAGFAVIYSDLHRVHHRVERIQTAIDALKSLS